MNIYIVRHGQTNLNKDRIMQGQSVYSYLDIQGQSEAKSIAERLKNIDFKHIYVSDLNRTQETADYIVKELVCSPKITYTKALRERSKGIFEGGSWEKFHKYCIENGPDTIFKAPEGGEALEEVFNRVGTFIEEIKPKYEENDNVLFVSHQGCMKMIFLYLLDMDIKHHVNLKFDNCSLSIFYIGDKYNKLLLANDTSHIK